MEPETYIVFFGMLGVFMLALHRMKYSCPPARIEYRYIKRDFQEAQDNPAEISELVTGMFEPSTIAKPQKRAQNGERKAQDPDKKPFGDWMSKQTK